MHVIYLLFYILLSYLAKRSTNYRNYRRTNGYDQRPNIVEPDIYETVHRIHGFFEKKRILDTLTNPSVPLYLKLHLVENRGMTAKPPDLFAGGLMCNFDFDMESDK